MAKRVLVPVADGSEEMEVSIVVDVLRRAGVEVVLASPGAQPITASRGLRLLPDAALADQFASTFDALVVPGGGPGVEVLMADAHLLGQVQAFVAEKKWVAAVCAGPRVLHAAGVLPPRFTCHPGVAAKLPPGRVNERVCESPGFITSQGPGTSFEFALRVVQVLLDAETAKALAEPLILPAEARG